MGLLRAISLGALVTSIAAHAPLRSSSFARPAAVRASAASPTSVVAVAASDVQQSGSMVDDIVDLAEKNYVNKASRMLQTLEKRAVQLQGIPRAELGRAYLAVWGSAERTRRWGLLITIYEHLVSDNVLTITDEMHDSALYACERVADGMLAEKIVRDAGANAERYNRAIRAHTKQLEVSEAVRLYRELQGEGWTLETQTINLMMQVCYAIKEVEYSLKLFNAMDALGVPADERSYAIAIRSATHESVVNAAEPGKEGAWVIALRMLNAMRAKQQAKGMPRLEGAPVVPSASCFDAVIRCLVSSGQAGKAASVLGQMIKAEHTPSVALFAAVARAWALKGRVNDAAETFEQMAELGVAPELPNVAALLLACERVGDAPRAIKALRSIPELGLQPTTLIYNMAIGACAKGGDIESVQMLLAEMDADSTLQPDIVTLNTVLDAYKRAHKWEQVLEFLLEMEETRKIAPDTVSVNTAIKACKDEEQFDIALQLFEGMGARGLTPDSVSYAEVIAACGKAGKWDRAVTAFEAAKASPLAMNIFIYNAVVGAAVACEKSERALELIKEMREVGLTPDIVTFTTVMTMCSRLEEWEAVLFLASELDNAGLSLTKPLFNQVQRARQALGLDRQSASV